MIKMVTMTGADDGTDPNELVRIWKEYPFVEWGILFSKSQTGAYRFPSIKWLHQLAQVKRDNHNLPLSLHLCGRYVRDFVGGNDAPVLEDLGHIWKIFNRVQLNFHAIPHSLSGSAITMFKKHQDKEFIFQHDGLNDKLIQVAALDKGCKVAALFDKSGGAGILPESWPHPLPGVYCGYAGGLGPDNLADQIELIIQASQGTDKWIDMETHVRSNMDSLFDLVLVDRALRITAPYAFNVFTEL